MDGRCVDGLPIRRLGGNEECHAHTTDTHTHIEKERQTGKTGNTAKVKNTRNIRGCRMVAAETMTNLIWG